MERTREIRLAKTKRESSSVNPDLSIISSSQKQQSNHSLTSAPTMLMQIATPPLANMQEFSCSGPARPFYQTGIRVNARDPTSIHWMSNSARTLQIHDPSKSSNQLYNEDVSLENFCFRSIRRKRRSLYSTLNRPPRPARVQSTQCCPDGLDLMVKDTAEKRRRCSPCWSQQCNHPSSKTITAMKMIWCSLCFHSRTCVWKSIE